MNRLDGQGAWANPQIVKRYRAWCGRLRVAPRPVSAEGAFAERGWACAVLDQIIAGIEQADPACAWIGIELIEEDDGLSLSAWRRRVRRGRCAERRSTTGRNS